jgi:hypothetical protein
MLVYGVNPLKLLDLNAQLFDIRVLYQYQATLYLAFINANSVGPRQEESFSYASSILSSIVN